MLIIPILKKLSQITFVLSVPPTSLESCMLGSWIPHEKAEFPQALEIMENLENH